MRLAHRRLLMLITDGVDQQECLLLRGGFEEEGAIVFTTAPAEYLAVESWHEGHPGVDIEVDMPFETVADVEFDGIILPDGVLSTEALRANEQVRDLLRAYYEASRPIFASGNAAEILYGSDLISDTVLVREGTPLETFIEEAVSVLAEPRVRWPVPTPS